MGRSRAQLSRTAPIQGRERESREKENEREHNYIVCVAAFAAFIIFVCGVAVAVLAEVEFDRQVAGRRLANVIDEAIMHFNSNNVLFFAVVIPKPS